MSEVLERRAMHPALQALLLVATVATVLLIPLLGIAVAVVVAVVAFRGGARVLAYVTATIAILLLAMLALGFTGSTTVIHEVS